jgi:TRAP transporter TAXI family solute receptor
VRGSLADQIAQQILEAYGITLDEIRSYGGTYEALDTRVMADQFKDGKSNVVIHNMNPGHPTISEIALSGVGRFIGMEDEPIRFVAQKYGYKAGSMPARTFENQPNPVQLPTFTTSLYAAANLPEPVAYQVTKTVIENIDALKRAFKAMEVLSKEEAVKPENLAIPLHPGAERYYKEAGLIR